MARPLPSANNPNPSDLVNRLYEDVETTHPAANGRHAPAPADGTDDLNDPESLRVENEQLRHLCMELEQALQEATSGHAAAGADPGAAAKLQDYEALLDQKDETIRRLHLQVKELEAIVNEGGGMDSGGGGGPSGAHVPREDELLRLSEELERERRQLQEDEQALMEQMRNMEVGMSRERAELARQRNDLLRLQSDVHLEIERLERQGAARSKIEDVKAKLQDAMNRRGAAPGAAEPRVTPPPVNQPPSGSHPATPPAKPGSGLFRRWLGGK